ncbi:hypothetical protein D9M72_552420 [compost metagenome]
MLSVKGVCNASTDTLRAPSLATARAKTWPQSRPVAWKRQTNPLLSPWVTSSPEPVISNGTPFSIVSGLIAMATALLHTPTMAETLDTSSSLCVAATPTVGLLSSSSITISSLRPLSTPPASALMNSAAFFAASAMPAP